MSDDLDPDVSRTDIVDSRVAAILRAKSGMERLRLAHEAWSSQSRRDCCVTQTSWRTQARAHPRSLGPLPCRRILFERGGGLGMLKVSGPEIDTAYVAEWAGRLGLTGIWDAVLKRGQTNE
jgi:hypothetical protein